MSWKDLGLIEQPELHQLQGMGSCRSFGDISAGGDFFGRDPSPPIGFGLRWLTAGG